MQISEAESTVKERFKMRHKRGQLKNTGPERWEAMRLGLWVETRTLNGCQTLAL